jgi:hypothetical protein
MNDERETIAACSLELRHLDFPRHPSFVLRHSHSNLDALKKTISLR